MTDCVTPVAMRTGVYYTRPFAQTGVSLHISQALNAKRIPLPGMTSMDPGLHGNRPFSDFEKVACGNR